jgi:hypothetical protein
LLGLLALVFAGLHLRSVMRTRYSDSPGIPLILDLSSQPAGAPQTARTLPHHPPFKAAAPRPEAPHHPQQNYRIPAVEPHPDTEQTVSLAWSAELPLEILPGKLELLEGEKAIREIQFVRTMSGPLEFTIGRSPGPPDRHIRLDEPTVSRLHAHMRLERGKGWLIANRSDTTPLRVNGREVIIPTDYRMLADGDLVQIGHVFLRFRN